MNVTTRRSALITLTAGVLAGPIAFVRSAARASGMMGADAGQSGGNTDMQTVMRLFADHTKIRRRVEPLANGVRAFTESDDPQIAALLQAHVATMYQRVDKGNFFTMMSRTLPTMFRNARRYRRSLAVTPHGVAITETSDDPAMVAVIRAHAEEVTGFVDEGMSAMMHGMMSGGMMGSRR